MQPNDQIKKPWLWQLQQKWAMSSVWQVIAVLVVFTLAGSTVVFLRKYLFVLLGFTPKTSFWWKVLTYLFFVFPAYQLLLLVYGFLLGQFSFFYQKEKKMMNWLIRKSNAVRTRIESYMTVK